MITSLEAFIIVLYLLPGFVGLIVYEVVAEVPKRETFDKFVIAIALTLLSNVIVSQLFAFATLARSSQDVPKSITAVVQNFGTIELAMAVIIAALLGLASAFVQNKGYVFLILRYFGIARRTGAIDVWHQVFGRFGSNWVRVKFKDGNFLIGWTKFYSEDGKAKELFIADATWHYLVPNGGVRDLKPTHRTEDVDGPGVLLINFDQVASIELCDGITREEEEEVNGSAGKTENHETWDALKLRE